MGPADPKLLRMVCTRNLEPVYDNGTIIRALEQLKKDKIDFKMTFIGDGSLADKLRRSVESSGLSPDVSFTGRLDNASLLKALQKHDIYLSASLWDGTSLALLEAMATGLLPIVSDIQANRTWIKDGEEGFLHGVEDPEDLARCIKQAGREPELLRRSSKLNRDKVVEKADRTRNMARLEKIYQTLVQ